MDIDAIITEAIASEPAQEPKQEQQDANQEDLSEKVETESDTTEQTEVETKKDDIFPKKAVNAISRRDKQIAKLKAEIEQFKSGLKAEGNKQNQKSEGMPKEEDFADKPYSEYLDAITEWKVEQKFKQTEQTLKEKQLEQEQSEWELERIEALDENETQAKKSFSDFEQTVAKALSEIQLEPHIRKAFLEVDNGAYALYAMAKDGALETLNDMSAMKAAILIGKYEDKGLALSKQKQQTKAPAPMTPNKGVGSGSKPLDTVQDVMAWLKS